MGAVLAWVNAIPFIDDPLAIELKVNPKHPKYVENLWVASNMLSQSISAYFEPPSELANLTLVPFMGRLAYPQEILPKIKECEARVQCLIETLDAFEGGVLRAECVEKPLTANQKYFQLPRTLH